MNNPKKKKSKNSRPKRQQKHNQVTNNTTYHVAVPQKSQTPQTKEKTLKQSLKKWFGEKYSTLCIWLWKFELKSIVLSNLITILFSIIVVAVYCYVSWATKSKALPEISTIALDAIVPSALTYFMSVIMQDLVEISSLKSEDLNWSFTIILIIFTIIYALIGIAVKATQAVFMIIITIILAVLNWAFAIFSLIQIDYHKKQIRTTSDPESK